MNPTRQFAAIYSQSCYINMLMKDNRVIGDYTLYLPYIRDHDRQRMVLLMERIHAMNDFKVETFYTAISLADRYLMIFVTNRVVKSTSAFGDVPCLTTLAVTCLMMASKLEEKVIPSISNIASKSSMTNKKQSIISMEKKIVLALDFDFAYASPVTFLERYQRLFAVDQEASDATMTDIGNTARQLCKYMQRHHEFLKFAPAQQASAALLLAIDLS